MTSPTLKRFALGFDRVWKEEFEGDILEPLQTPPGFPLGEPDRFTPQPVAIARGSASKYYVIVGDPKNDRAFVWSWTFSDPNNVTSVGDGMTAGVIRGDPGTQFGYSVAVDTVYSATSPSQVPVFAIGAPRSETGPFEDPTGQVFSTFILANNPNQVQPLRAVVNDPQDYGLTEGARFGHAVDIAKSHDTASALVVASDTQSGEEVVNGVTNRWTGRAHIARTANFANQSWVHEATFRDDGRGDQPSGSDELAQAEKALLLRNSRVSV